MGGLSGLIPHVYCVNNFFFGELSSLPSYCPCGLQISLSGVMTAKGRHCPSFSSQRAGGTGGWRAKLERHRRFETVIPPHGFCFP